MTPDILAALGLVATGLGLAGALLLARVAETLAVVTPSASSVAVLAVVFCACVVGAVWFGVGLLKGKK